MSNGAAKSAGIEVHVDPQTYPRPLDCIQINSMMARNPSAGVLNCELIKDEWGREAIIAEFEDRKQRYLDNAERPGPQRVASMRRLAQAGDGLTTYISQQAREYYAAKFPL